MGHFPKRKYPSLIADRPKIHVSYFGYPKVHIESPNLIKLCVEQAKAFVLEMISDNRIQEIDNLYLFSDGQQEETGVLGHSTFNLLRIRWHLLYF